MMGLGGGANAAPNLAGLDPATAAAAQNMMPRVLQVC